MSEIQAGAHRFQANQYFDDPLPAQLWLARARADAGYAVCHCVQPGRRLVIREVQKILYLAVWPNDGPFHDIDCEFHRDTTSDVAKGTDKPLGPVETDGSVKQQKPAAVVTGDGNWDIKLDWPRRDSPPLSTERKARNDSEGATSSRSERKSFALSEFLSWMWESTSMVRWGKGWRRDWWRVARSIRTEAEAIRIDGKALNEMLYVPPPFRRDLESVIHAEWERFADPLHSNDKFEQKPVGLILAEIKVVDKTDYGFRLMARNMAKPIYVDTMVYAAMAKQSPLALALLPKRKQLECSVVALLMVEGTGKGNIRTIGVALMLVNSQFIPVSTIYELELANRLCAQDRTFTRGVGKSQGADFVLRDTVPPTAMIIYSLVSPDYVKQRDALAKQCLEAGCTIWKWYPAAAEEVPMIPR